MRKPVLSALAGFALAASCLGTSWAGGFTAEQAEAGKSAYTTNCGRCHGYNLEGVEAPGLVGRDVMGNWDTAGGLYDFISVAMPPEAPGELGEETYLNIVAYIMSFNGAQPGNEPLAVGDKLYDISLVAETSAGGSTTVAQATPAVSQASSDVPQAFTWGKPLPGGQPAQAEPEKPGVPQAFTWGKQLPQVGQR